MRQARVAALLWVVLALCAGTAQAYSISELLRFRFDPRLRFQTIETAHFRIHHPLQLADQAAHLASLAEPVHAQVTSRLGWTPPGKTDVVLVHDNERTNAFTISYPTTQILINNVPPYLTQGIFHYGDWMRWLLAHEYAHVVHQGRVAGLSRALAPALGAFARPNMLQPAWLKEGIAVLSESELDSAGRAGSTTYRMFFRVAERDGQLGRHDFGSFESAGHYRGETWPWIYRTYLWGAALCQTMEAIRPGSIKDVVAATARGWPGFLGGGLRSARLPGAALLHGETVAWLRSRARAELDRLGRRPETEVVYLTRDGYNKFGPAISPDGLELLFTRERPELDNAVVLLELGAGGEVARRRELFPHDTGYQLSYSRSGRFVAFDTIDVFGGHYFWSDVFLWDRQTDTPLLRSKGLRARDADIHPNGLQLVFVQTVDSRNRIVVSDSAFGNATVVYQPDGFRRLTQTRWSPDGSRVVFTEHDDDRGGERLMLWSADGSVRALTDGASVDRDPHFSPDGAHVVFSSDRTGAYQIHALDLGDGAVRQVTHRQGGAFWPVPDPSGRHLYFLDYGSAGFDLVRMPWNPAAWWVSDAEDALAPTGSREARGPGLAPASAVRPAAGVHAPRPYSSWTYLAPQFVRPAVGVRHGGVQVGLATGSVDPAFLRHYRLSLRWDTAARAAVGEALWYDGSRRLPWVVQAGRDAFPVEGGATRLDASWLDLRLYVPAGDLLPRRNVQVGLSGQRYVRDGVSQIMGGPTLRFERDRRVTQPNDLTAESGSLITVQGSQLLRRDASPVSLIEFSGEKAMRLTFLGAHAVASPALHGAALIRGGGPEYLLHAGGQESFPFGVRSRYRLDGYDPNVLPADRVGIASLRLTRPIVRVERGLATAPAFVHRLSLGVRAAAGVIERAGRRIHPWTVGGELVLETQLTAGFPIVWTLGLHRGDRATGGTTRLVVAASKAY